MHDEAAYWRDCAEAYELVAGTAAQRGSNPLLVTKMRETAVRYRQWADRTERETRDCPWPGSWLPSSPWHSRRLLWYPRRPGTPEAPHPAEAPGILTPV